MRKLKDGKTKKTGRRKAKGAKKAKVREFVLVPGLRSGDQDLGVYLNPGEAQHVTALAFRAFIERDADRRAEAEKSLRGALVGISERQRQLQILRNHNLRVRAADAAKSKKVVRK